MAVPVALAMIVACGSLVTSAKSAWELSRMIKRKLNEVHVIEDAWRIEDELEKAVKNGLLSAEEYQEWYETLVIAKSEQSGMLQDQSLLTCSK